MNLYSTLRKAFFIFTLLITVSAARAQYVAIPDGNFGDWLYNNGYAACMAGNSTSGYLLDISCPAVTSATSMNIFGTNASDLTGIEYFTNVDTLFCIGNYITSLSHLPPSLRVLYCYGSTLTDIPALPATLTYLECWNNQLISLPALPTSLTYLSCGQNQLSRLPALPASLTFLDCSRCQIDSLPTLPASLTNLSCGYNLLTAVPVLPASLTAFDCSHNPMSSLPVLPAGLGSLACYGDLLTALPILPGGLYYLACDNNQIDSLPALPVTMNTLNCGHNPISHLPRLSHLPLNILECDSDMLTSLPDLPGTLSSLNCAQNLLSSLPVLPASLTELFCYDNANLSCLPRIIHNQMDRFFISGTRIRCLPNRFSSQNYDINPDTMALCGPANGCDFYYNISGTVHFDSAASCVVDSLHPGQSIHNVKVQLKQAGTVIQQFYTFRSGEYSFKTPSLSAYTVSVDTAGLPIAVSCPSSGQRGVTLSAIDSVKPYQSFGMVCAGTDYSVMYISGSRFRPAVASHISISAGNISLIRYNANCPGHISGTITTTLSGSVSYTAAAPGALTPTSVAGSVLTYSIGDLDSLHTGSLDIIVATDSHAVIGSSVCITTSINPSVPDVNAADNTMTQCFSVRNSYDPNLKSVSPTDTISIVAQWLTYTVDFQNTGTDTAYTVVVKDTLSQYLDASSFQYLASSHNAVVQLFGNAMAFTFPHVNLVDSGTNEPLSHGWIQYKVRTNASLPLGTQIQNTASIYFDLNAAVVTNTTVNTVSAASICNSARDTIRATICSGQTYTFHGRPLTVQSTYYDTLPIAGGCDTFRVLYLSVVPVPTAMISTTGLGCAGRDTLTLGWASGTFSVQWYRNNTLVSTQNLSQTIQTVAGGNGGGATPLRLGAPSDIFVDRTGYLYVADEGNHRIQRFPPGSTTDSLGVTIAGITSSGGNAAAQLYLPSAVVTDSAGYVYVTDQGNHRIQKFPPGSTSYTNGVTVAGGNGNSFGANQLNSPANIYLDATGNMYVADGLNSRIQKFPPGSTSATNGVTVAGSLSAGSAANQLSFVTAVGLDGQGNIYAGDQVNTRIQKFPAGSTSGTNAVTVALGNLSGLAQNQVTNLGHIFVDKAGNVYVADFYTNGRILKFPTGSTSATYGINVAGGYGDGNAYNQLKEPRGVFVDSAGNIYVADMDNDRIQKYGPMAPPAYAPTAAGSYRAVLTTSSGCIDTTNTIVISAIQTPSVAVSASHLSILSGVNDTFTATTVYGGATPTYQWYRNGLPVGTNAPTYVSSFYTADSVWCVMHSSACASPDSAVSNHLHITLACRNIYDTIRASFCAGSTYIFAGQTLTHAGRYADTMTAVNGCDSIEILLLTAIPLARTTASQSICPGSSYTFFGRTLTQAGVYYDTLTAASGCDSIYTLYLSVLNDSIHAQFTLQPSSTPHLWYLLNQCSGPNALSYIWTWGDGSAVSTGDTPSHTFAAAGFYTICVDASDALGCSAQYCDSNAYINKSEAGQIVQVNVVRQIPNGINILSENYLAIAPNPNTGTFTLETTLQQGNQYTIYDMLGQVIQEQPITADTQHIDLADAAQGIYTLVIKGSNGSVRFTVMR